MFTTNMITNITNNITFSSQKLFRAQIEKEFIDRGREPLDAYITLLDKSDLDSFELQDENWLDEYGHRDIGNDIIWDLKRKKETPQWEKTYFLGVECPSEEDGKKVKAMAEIIDCDNGVVKLDLLQSKTPIEDLSSKTHGAGSCLIYMLLHLAEKLNAKKIKITSLDESSSAFYRKMGFENEFKSLYSMQAPQISQRRKELEEKYKITPFSA
ncbi:MAG: hypothetical protein K6A44_02500 [bacterium]|nr:hypothetical protein [bacterium]